MKERKEEGRKGGRERGREEGREEGRKGERKGGREREGGRKRGRAYSANRKFFRLVSLISNDGCGRRRGWRRGSSSSRGWSLLLRRREYNRSLIIP